MSAPYYIAAYGGFLVIEGYDTPTGWREKCYTIADCRSATPFNDFAKADATAKWAVAHLYPPDLRYFGLFQVASGAESGGGVLAELVRALEDLGFGTDGDVDGGDAVDAINEYWAELQRLVGA